MEGVTFNEAALWCKGTIAAGDSQSALGRISIDTRKIEPGDTYVAIVGERLDGHDFIESAFEKGVRKFVVEPGRVDDKSYYAGSTVLEVEDTTKALGDIARGYRDRFDIPYIGVTGSCGKTSTRNMVWSVLSQKLSTHKNSGNFNNHIGLPLTMFELGSSHQAAVLEMGMSGFGEIEYLASIVRPRIAVITNIGYSHIENLGSKENILKAKLEITSYFDETCTLIVNGDDEQLRTLRPGSYKMIKFGFEPGNDIVCTEVRDQGGMLEFSVNWGAHDEKFSIPSKGMHNVYNAMAAMAVGIECGLGFDEIRRGLLQFENEKMRLDIVEKSFIIINDAYNANPDSMKAAIDFLAGYEEKRKIAVLADMLEMGEFSREGHEIVGEYAAGRVDILVSVGGAAAYISSRARECGLENVVHFEDRQGAMEYLDELVRPGDVVLVKGSRSMKMEEIANHLQEGSSK
ncbi:UDP-N-acetylmuramoyl-tripeptide--D-alanyl-D-alanine ligase MurF [Peptoclostridium acidaminophilum DSM 3953]|uniref:UDP-N-acetylmuramoyl-tripeptide--D-alanyl-D-alanine ligase n=1 Tax=Peptoclostridium acidaminophilum DSM 3953 TaxID=1286171 RepID=W8TJE2_PEPAC|nr:UDP-N-acetylmuramoyl-tripeptide--D-alanyl-D-alanine ligase [Peptoclostridium acidaminophilum]AHM56342.1 UDP-N-acetylmuramoyl-tripeptide--D-alanyl-D-alanine ligase MurF [Peptoclostridium acidaminophilum DSM 3953]